MRGMLSWLTVFSRFVACCSGSRRRCKPATLVEGGRRGQLTSRGSRERGRTICSTTESICN